MGPRKCIKCGSPVVDTTATGRPKYYCSMACRRAAEHQIGRINRLLGKLEEQASNARLGCGYPTPEHIQLLADEIAMQEARLRALLEGSTAE